MPKKFLALLLTLLFSTGLLAASVYLLGTNGAVMLHLMQRYAPAETTGLPASEYAAVADMTTAYLAGQTDAFQHTYAADGAEVLAFSEREQQHMADVQALFRLARSVMVTNICLAIVLCGTALTVFGRDALRRMLKFVGIATLAAVTVLVLAACIDFDGLFVLFHKIAFTNDLWLLDPRTDLLIRLMPLDFFVAYAAYIGLAWAAAMALVTLIPLWLTKERNA